MAIGNNTIVSGMVDGSGMADSGTTYTLSGVDTTGTDTYLLVGLAYNNNDEQTPSVQYDPGGADQQDLTAISGTQRITPSTGTRDDGYTEWWGGIVASNASKSVKVTVTSAIISNEGLAMVVIPLTGVDQTTPANNGTGDIQDGGTTLQATVTTTTGDKVYGIAFQEGASGTDLSAGSGETEEVSFSSTNDEAWVGSLAGAASSVSFDVSSGLNDKMVLSCVNIQQGAGAHTSTGAMTVGGLTITASGLQRPTRTQHSFRVYKGGISD